MGSPGGRAPGSLPASARARLDQLRAGKLPRTSYLSAASAAALRSIGFVAVGDVMGCATSQIGFAYVPSCSSGRAGVRTCASAVPRPGGGTGYLGLVRGLYAKALRRLTDEAVALGADGVVGISLTSTERDQVTEVVALGTAVRGDTSRRAPHPFTTDLAATDVAKLLLDGWVPVTLHVAAQLGVRHVDLTSAMFMHAARSRWTNNVGWAGANAEVDAPTELVQETKAAARAVLAGQVARAGADGCLLSTLDVTFRERACQSVTGGRGDVAGLCVAVGTSVARTGAVPVRASPVLTIMPVDARGRT